MILSIINPLAPESLLGVPRPLINLAGPVVPPPEHQSQQFLQHTS